MHVVALQRKLERGRHTSSTWRRPAADQVVMHIQPLHLAPAVDPRVMTLNPGALTWRHSLVGWVVAADWAEEGSAVAAEHTGMVHFRRG